MGSGGLPEFARIIRRPKGFSSVAQGIGSTPECVAAAVLALAGCAVPDHAVVMGPAVQPAAECSVKVAFETAGPALLHFDLIDERGRIERTLANSFPRRRHVFTVTDLFPDSRYAYTVRLPGEGGAIAEGSAATPPDDRGRAFRLAVVGDSGPVGWFRRKPQWKVAAGILEFEPDIVLHTGDVIYSRGGDPAAELSEGYFRPFGEVLRSTPVYATPGNHDAEMGDCGPYLRAFELPEGPEGERYYSFDHGPAHFVSVDTSTVDSLTRAQLEWLEHDLAASDRRWKIVFTHRPPLISPRREEDPAFLAPLLEISARTGVRLLLAGHDHAYIRYRPLGEDGRLTLIVTGGGGGSLQPQPGPGPRIAALAVVHHHLRAHVSEERIAIEAVDIEGKVIDSVVLE